MRFLSTLIIAILFSSHAFCDNIKERKNDQVLEEVLTDEEVKNLDTLEVKHYKVEDFLLPNGEPIKNYLDEKSDTKEKR